MKTQLLDQAHLMDVICTAVADEFGVPGTVMYTREQTRSTRTVAEARQVAVYLMRLHTDKTMSDICKEMDIKERQTINYCVRRTIASQTVNLDFRRQLARIELKIWELMGG
ncbi:MAG: hypothetical protein BGO70_06940 [Bacteroidetes bacterium 43-93]|nr:hypothetical protein [Bacteroidota bacterium]OJW97518.1 MAG: hypothetical protein BGO70_06940 [Bacteroidetes bacterium 43-93]